MSERAARAGLGVTFALAAISMYGPFTTDTVFPAFAQIGVQLRADDAALQQITSVYLLAFAFAGLVLGPVSDAVGRRPVMVVSTLAYAAASVGCALAPSLGWLLVFRALQGVTAAGGLIISRTMVRDLFSGPEAQRLMSHIAMIFGLAPAIAPILGGLLLGLGRWPVIFWFLVVYGLFTCACALWLPESHPADNRTPLRLAPVFRNLTEVVRHGSFLRIAFASSLGFAAQFLYIASAPIFVVTLLGKGERDFWIFFVPMIVGMISGAFVSGRLAGRIAAPRLAGIGFLVSASAAAMNLALMSTGVDALPWPVLGPMVMAFGNQLFFPITQLAMLDLFPRFRGAAASMGSFLSLLVNAALAGLVSPLVTGSLTQLAAASLGFVLVGWALWTWHRRWLART
ncbi:multidrug effflux MFS transporter [Mariniluteicoccus endophyticus]